MLKVINGFLLLETLRVVRLARLVRMLRLLRNPVFEMLFMTIALSVISFIAIWILFETAHLHTADVLWEANVEFQVRGTSWRRSWGLVCVGYRCEGWARCSHLQAQRDGQA
jgi:hypothetical protein